VLLILLYRVLAKKTIGNWLVVAFAFVIGGGIGNLIDRIAYGSVTDFFQIRLGVLKTGIFNMADVAVTFGVILILLLSVFGKKISI
jgi:signal peptidase II